MGPTNCTEWDMDINDLIYKPEEFISRTKLYITQDKSDTVYYTMMNVLNGIDYLKYKPKGEQEEYFKQYLLTLPEGLFIQAVKHVIRYKDTALARHYHLLCQDPDIFERTLKIDIKANVRARQLKKRRKK